MLCRGLDLLQSCSVAAMLQFRIVDCNLLLPFDGQGPIVSIPPFLMNCCIFLTHFAHLRGEFFAVGPPLLLVQCALLYEFGLQLVCRACKMLCNGSHLLHELLFAFVFVVLEIRA